MTQRDLEQGPYARTTVPQAFSHWANTSPDAIALSYHGQSWSYRQLDEQANRVAHWLVSRLGCGLEGLPEPLIPVCLNQGPQRIAALLAIIKLGGAYVPIEPDYPAARIRYMLEDIDARCLLTESVLAGDILAARDAHDRPLEILAIDADKVAIAHEDASPVEPNLTPDSLCYIIYTSGSTGRPKGVAVPHRGVTRLVLNTDYVQIRPGDCVAQASNVAFDASTFEIWGALLNGARLALLGKDTVLNARRLAEALRGEQVNIMFMTAGLFNQHVAVDPGVFAPLDYLLVGGEAPSVDAVRRLMSFPGRPRHLLNGYGPTENTTFSTYYEFLEIPEPGAPLPIGRPIAYSSCRVVDAELRPVAAGGTGELLVGGAGLAREYWRNPEATAEKFVTGLPGTDGERYYRTGDVVRLLPSGDLVFLGRVDNQVKIRGFRVELEEIELALEAHPELARAVVRVAEDVSHTKRLLAYLLPRPGGVLPSVAELRAFVEQRLPAVMVPSAFIRVAHLPLNASGKVDRQALAALAGEVLWSEEECAEPRSGLEQRLRRRWSEYLQVAEAQIGVTQNFFELGGHSLAAALILADLRDALGIELQVQDFFAAPTIAGLAAAVSARTASAAIDIPPVERTDDLPLSWSQEQIWLHQQLAPETPFYNEPLNITLPEAIEPGALQKALGLLLERHEALRARIGIKRGLPRQRIAPPEPIDLPVFDLRHLPRQRAEAEARDLASAQACQPFLLETGPLIRFLLVRMENQLWRLYLAGHHLVLDGVAIFQVFLPELETLYRQCMAGQPPALPPVRFRFRDWLVWQREPAACARWAGQEGYWQTKLADLEPLSLPTDHPRNDKEDYAGARICFGLSQRCTQRLRELARHEQTSLFMTLLAGFKILLLRWTQQRDIAIGTVVAGRDLPGLQQHIGDCLNTLILRTLLPEDAGFSGVLAAVRATCLEAFAHQDIPFQQVSRYAASASGSAGSGSPIRVAFVFEPQVAASAGGWELSQMEIHTGTAKFDLTFELDERPDRIIGRVEYRTGLFQAATIERLLHHFEVLLDSLLDHPGTRAAELCLVDKQDRHTQLTEWLDNEVDYGPAISLQALIEAQVDKTPEATAVIFEDRRLSYREFDEQANRLAHLLRDYGVGPEIPVGVWTERSADHLVMLYAILKAGGAYVPMGSNDPVDRAHFILADTAAPVVLCDTAHRQRLDGVRARVLVYEEAQARLAQEPAARPVSQTRAEHLAYIIYTSGSTGRPKGVMTEHRQIVDRTYWAQAHLRAGSSDVFLHMFSLPFDGAIIPTWWPMSQGCPTLMPSSAQIQNMEALADLILRHNVTYLAATPAILGALLDVLDRQAAPEPSLRYIMPAGERLSAELLDRLRKVAPRVVNGYGPTETTILATFWEAPAGLAERPPIGIGVANTRLYVLDKAKQLVPVGVPGELHIGGRGVARGYLNRPELSEQHFLPDPFLPGARVYRTGDIVRYLPSGDLEFLGRADNQVKIRGYRIELGEIEETLRGYPGIQDTVVIVHEQPSGMKQLQAYIATGDTEPALPALRDYLRGRLPDYMVPPVLVPLATLPLTANGKVNIRALPKPPEADGQSHQEDQLPGNELERQLHKLWSKVLGIKTIGVRQDFYSLGGDSLLALQLVAQAGEQGLPLRLRDLFEHRTLAGLAAHLADSKHANRFAKQAPGHLDSSHEPLEGACPLLPIQRWFFEHRFPDPHHWNQAFIVHPRRRLLVENLAQALEKLAEHHDALRLRCHPRGDNVEQVYQAAKRPDSAPKLTVVDLSNVEERDRAAILRSECGRLHARLNYSEGPVALAALFESGPGQPQTLWLGFHHLVIDGVSWRILLDDLGRLYSQLERGEATRLPGKSWSLRQWEQALRTYAEGEALEELPFWQAQLADPPPPAWPLGTAGRVAEKQTLVFHLDTALTGDLVSRVPQWAGAEINAVLLTALAAALDGEACRIWLEGHGREPITEEADLSRTLGWFTSIFPLVLPAGQGRGLWPLLDEIKARVAQVPHHGLGYLALRYLAPRPEIREALRLPNPLPISFNYLGRFDSEAGSGLFRLGAEPAGELHGADNPRIAVLELNCLVLENQFRMDWSFAGNDAERRWVEALAQRYCQALADLARQSRRRAGDMAPAPHPAADTLLPLRAEGSRRPLFLVHPAGGNALSYRELAALLDPDQPVYGLECTDGYADKSFRGMAAAYVRAIRSVQPQGPYLLGGWSLGGILAHEMAVQLEVQGEQVAAVFHLDSRPITHQRQADYMRLMRDNSAALLGLLTRHLEQIAGKPIAIDYATLAAQPEGEVESWFMSQLSQRGIFPETLVLGFIQRFVDDFRACYRLAMQYRDPGRCRAPALLFRATEISEPHPGFLPLEEPPRTGQDLSYGWDALTLQPVAVHLVPGNHETFVFAPYVNQLAAMLNAEIDRVRDTSRDDVCSVFGETLVT